MSEHENPSPQWALHEHELWLESLPELTDKERAALDLVDMTEVLGTPDKRERVAIDAALRYMRRCREKAAEIERLRGENAELRELLKIALWGLTHPFLGEQMEIVFPGVGTSWHEAAQKAAGGE